MADEGKAWEPDWLTCGTPGCIGIRLKDTERCLTHVEPQAREAFLAMLKPGADLDLRGTRIDPGLLSGLLAAVRSEHSPPTLGHAWFDYAQFSGPTGFEEAQFSGYADFSWTQFNATARFDKTQFMKAVQFNGARFHAAAQFTEAQFAEAVHFSGAQFGDAGFGRVQFSDDAWFGAAQFSGDAWFGRAHFHAVAEFTDAQFRQTANFSDAQFNAVAEFSQTQFTNTAWFDPAQFSGAAQFDAAQFSGDAWFDGAQFNGAVGFVATRFTGVARFTGANFKQARSVGPLFAGQVVFDQGTFEQAVTIEAASAMLSCVDTRFNDSVTLRLRYAETVVDGAMFTRPSTIAFAEDIFMSPEGMEKETFDEGAVRRAADGRSPRPRLLSLRGVDVSGVTLGDLDLSACLFQGSHNLDKIRIEGRSPFTSTPRGWKFGRVGGQGVPMWRWTHRWALAEEHHWRASQDLPAAPNGRPHPKRAGWYPPAVRPPNWLTVRTGQRVQPLPPGRIAIWYRALRKAWEDSKNEPGAADFYYGEMEMRRLGSGTHWGERVILTLYWLVSGYGLRGLRALAWLAAVVVGLGILFELVGFAGHPSPPTVWGSLLYAARSTLSITDPEAQLTGWGKLLQLILRLAGPVLLGLALLAVRNRVKR